MVCIFSYIILQSWTREISPRSFAAHVPGMMQVQNSKFHQKWMALKGHPRLKSKINKSRSLKTEVENYTSKINIQPLILTTILNITISKKYLHLQKIDRSKQ